MCKHELLFEKLLVTDVKKTAANDDDYFVFEDTMHQVTYSLITCMYMPVTQTVCSRGGLFYAESARHMYIYIRYVYGTCDDLYTYEVIELYEIFSTVQ